MNHRAPVIVIGSANQDYILRVPNPPHLGETVLATSLLRQPGGKGANQAVAAARLRGIVSFVGCVGDDEDGASLIRVLRAEGIDASNVEIIGRGRTGIAMVTVFDSGENTILVAPGSNFDLTPRKVRMAIARIGSPDGIVALQAELKPDVIATAIQAATESGMRVVFNLAPYQDVPSEILEQADPLIVNESEASALTGHAVHDVHSATVAIAELRTMARSAVITLGAGGAVWAEEGAGGHVAAAAVSGVVDTTGAGDAFVGAVAVLLSEGAPLSFAVEVGVRAGTFAVGSPGAQSSYPTRRDLGLSDSEAELVRGDSYGAA